MNVFFHGYRDDAVLLHEDAMAALEELEQEINLMVAQITMIGRRLSWQENGATCIDDLVQEIQDLKVRRFQLLQQFFQESDSSQRKEL